MGVRTSEVGYTIATTRRETTKVRKNMWWHCRGEEKNFVKYRVRLSLVASHVVGNTIVI
jgi:hypothetical protein